MEPETTPQTVDAKKSTLQTVVAFAALIGVVAITFLFIRNLNTQHNLANTAPTGTPITLVPFSGHFAPIQEGDWQLVRFTNAQGTTTLQKRYILHFTQNTLSGTICNLISAPYTVEGTDEKPEMRFTLMQRSKILCSNAEMRPEEALASSLRGGLEVSLSANQEQLTLIGDSTNYQFVLVKVP